MRDDPPRSSVASERDDQGGVSVATVPDLPGDRLHGRTGEAVMRWGRGPAAIGARIRACRRQHGLDRLTFALAAPLDVGNLALIERGHHRPRPATLRRIAGALVVEPAALIGDEAARGDGDGA